MLAHVLAHIWAHILAGTATRGYLMRDTSSLNQTSLISMSSMRSARNELAIKQARSDFSSNC